MAPSRTILVIDDRELVVAILMQALDMEGFDVIGAATAEEGLELAARHYPDLILSDYRMEGTNGLEFLDALRANPKTASIPFVLVTVDEDPALRESARLRGVNAFLRKPFEMEDLVEVIRNCLTTTSVSVASDPS